jgi:hypothetical protein
MRVRGGGSEDGTARCIRGEGYKVTFAKYLGDAFFPS